MKWAVSYQQEAEVLAFVLNFSLKLKCSIFDFSKVCFIQHPSKT